MTGTLEWKPIQGYENEYMVSNRGDVWSVRRHRALKPNKDKYGYLYFVFSVDSVRRTVKAHRLVATAFIENTFNKPTVNHKNGIRHDNRVDNLEWATVKEQANDERTYKNMLAVSAKTDYRAMGQKRDFGRRRTAVYRGKTLVGIYESLMTAAKENGINYSKASECANGHRKNTGGMKVCFV